MKTLEDLFVWPRASVQGLIAGAIGTLARQVVEHHKMILTIITSSSHLPLAYHSSALSIFLSLVPDLEAFYLILPYWFCDKPLSKHSLSTQCCIHTPSEQKLNPLRMPLTKVREAEWALSSGKSFNAEFACLWNKVGKKHRSNHSFPHLFSHD